MIILTIIAYRRNKRVLECFDSGSAQRYLIPGAQFHRAAKQKFA